VKEVDEVFDLIGLEDVAKRRHGSAAVLDLMLNFVFVEAFSDGAEVGAQLASAAVWAVAMLASLFVEERGSGVLRLVRVGVNDGGGPLCEAACQSYDDRRETEGSTEWGGGDFADYLQGGEYLSAIYRELACGC
jgi:hypothetical protein